MRTKDMQQWADFLEQAAKVLQEMIAVKSRKVAATSVFENLELCPYLRSRLREQGITTLAALCKLTPRQAMARFGQGYTTELAAALHEQGLQFLEVKAPPAPKPTKPPKQVQITDLVGLRDLQLPDKGILEALRKNGIRDVQALCRMTQDELLTCKWIGLVRVMQIIEALAQRGLRLRGSK